MRRSARRDDDEERRDGGERRRITRELVANVREYIIKYFAKSQKEQRARTYSRFDERDAREMESARSRYNFHRLAKFYGITEGRRCYRE